MANLISLLVALSILQFTVAQSTCAPHGGPSIYEYDIDKQVTYRAVTRNLVEGWRQYGDKLLYRGNYNIRRNGIGKKTSVFSYPLDGRNGNFNITHIISVDTYGSYGAVANLLDGGIGDHRVRIGYRYTPAYGVQHRVEIYGRDWRKTVPVPSFYISSAWSDPSYISGGLP